VVTTVERPPEETSRVSGGEGGSHGESVPWFVGELARRERRRGSEPAALRTKAPAGVRTVCLEGVCRVQSGTI
jgi:hypothetical protein